MKRCKVCGSYAFNLYKEDIDQGDLCDVHYWKEKALSSTNGEAQPAVTESHKQRSVSEHLEPVATDWERIARVQNAKLMAMCNEAGGFEKLCEVMDKYERITPPQRTAAVGEDTKAWVGLTDEEIEKGRDKTFSINNPYCPCDSKTMRKAVRWAEAKLKVKNERLEKNT